MGVGKYGKFLEMLLFVGFWVSAGFGFEDRFPPESKFDSDSDFKFGFQFSVSRHSTQTEPHLLPSLATGAGERRPGPLPRAPRPWCGAARHEPELAGIRAGLAIARTGLVDGLARSQSSIASLERCRPRAPLPSRAAHTGLV